MIVASLILVPIAGAVIWAFLRFAPAHVEYKVLLRFNLGALAAALMAVAAWCVRTYVVMSHTEDSAWWPVISLLGALAILPLVLGLAAVARNFVVFRVRSGEPPR